MYIYILKYIKETTKIIIFVGILSVNLVQYFSTNMDNFLVTVLKPVVRGLTKTILNKSLTFALISRNEFIIGIF